MINDNDIEKLLLNVPRAHVRAGRHRSDLKAKLLQTPYHERLSMKTRKWKWAIAACSAMLLLSAVGWAAQQGYFNFKQFIVEEKEGDVNILSDGSAQCSKTMVGVLTDDPQATQETANQQWREIKKAIEKGRYQLMKTEIINGITAYHYTVTLEDGTQAGFGTNTPLPEPKPQEP